MSRVPYTTSQQPASGSETPALWPRPRPNGESVEAAIERGALLGRYVVLHALGSGGMGRVYAAYDPELDRKVALKVLAADLAVEGARDLLLGEAQATARLAHPNVVTVHDVGAVGDRLFVAMELVDGWTLDAWLAAAPRSAGDVLRVFLAAGRGLAAAHAAGLAHRDVKPGNVMVARDGRVVVLDFGLARALVGEPRPGEAAVPARGVSVALGTPVYMAPEQRRGERADARSDQFSFCVALWEALHGELPASAAGTVPSAARDEVGRGGRSVPVRVRRVLLRGLASDPADRYPSMEALLVALGRHPAARRRLLRAAGAAALLAGVLAAGARLVAPPADELLCSGAERHLEGIWDAGRKRGARRVFLTSGVPWAADAWERASAALDATAGAWVEAHTAACVATRLHGEQSEAMLDLQMTCLDARLREIEAAADLLAAADAEVVRRAGEIAGGRVDLAACRDRRALQSVVPLPTEPAAAGEVARLRTRLAHAKALESAGRYAESLAVSEAVAQRAAALAYAPLSAEALLRLAIGQGRTGRREEMRDTLLAASRAAQAGSHDRVLADIFNHLIVSAVVRGQAAEAHLWEPLAAGAIERLGERGELAAQRRVFLGMLAILEGHFEAAVEHYEAALSLDPEVTALERGAAANSLGIAHLRLGRPGAARRELQEAIRSMESGHGRQHPLLMGPLVNLGNLSWERGDAAAALPLYRRALAIAESAGLADNPDVAHALTGAGRSLVDLGRGSEAVATLERAVELREIHPVAPELLAASRFHLARALWDSGGDRDRAVRLAVAAHDVYAALGDRAQPDTARVAAWLAARQRERP